MRTTPVSTAPVDLTDGKTITARVVSAPRPRHARGTEDVATYCAWGGELTAGSEEDISVETPLGACGRKGVIPNRVAPQADTHNKCAYDKCAYLLQVIVGRPLEAETALIVFILVAHWSLAAIRKHLT